LRHFSVSTSIEPFFLAVGGGPLGQRFAIHHRPGGRATPRALVLQVHPFAEEMNKSRRMLALQSRALAAQGCAVLQIDLLGCGDSAGDFGDATWAAWVEDLVAACGWLRQRHGREAPLVLWGLRAGCLLAAEAAERLDEPCDLLFWQPANSGKALLQQFLRLKVAGEILGGQARGVTEQLRAELASGQPVEVAGYRLHPALCSGLEAAALHPPSRPGRVEWIELSAREGASPGPAAVASAARWRDAGWQLHLQTVQGPPFWQTTEVEDAPGLLSASRCLLDDPPTSAPAALAEALRA
jgi:exosortase A-associated hydrolase 2